MKTEYEIRDELKKLEKQSENLGYDYIETKKIKYREAQLIIDAMISQLKWVLKD